MTETRISGADVANATMVSPIRSGATPRLRAMAAAPCTKRSAPQIRRIRPATISRTLPSIIQKSSEAVGYRRLVVSGPDCSSGICRRRDTDPGRGLSYTNGCSALDWQSVFATLRALFRRQKASTYPRWNQTKIKSADRGRPARRRRRGPERRQHALHEALVVSERIRRQAADRAAPARLPVPG